MQCYCFPGIFCCFFIHFCIYSSALLCCLRVSMISGVYFFIISCINLYLYCNCQYHGYVIHHCMQELMMSQTFSFNGNNIITASDLINILGKVSIRNGVYNFEFINNKKLIVIFYENLSQKYPTVLRYRNIDRSIYIISTVFLLKLMIILPID